MTQPLAPEIEKAVAFLWEIAESMDDTHDVCMLRRCAGALERLDRENRELRGERREAA